MLYQKTFRVLPSCLFCGASKFQFHVLRGFSQGKPSLTPIKMAFKVTKPENAGAPLMNNSIVIMHGLLGNKNNWNSLAKVIAQKTNQSVYTVDARNHGESPHTDEFSYALLAEDVKYFLETEHLTPANVIGHSMGGRAMMYLALKYPHLVASLVVVDISPLGISPTVQQMSGLFDAMQMIDLSKLAGQPMTAVRKVVDQFLTPVIDDMGVRQFIMTNLREAESKNHPVWQCNLKALQKQFFNHMINFTLPKENASFEGPTMFIKGILSDFIRVVDYGGILKIFPKSDMAVIEDAGHWVHSQKPARFVEEVVEFYERLPNFIPGVLNHRKDYPKHG